MASQPTTSVETNTITQPSSSIIQKGSPTSRDASLPPASLETPIHSKTPPPSVPPESPEEVPFDFQTFLDQMKTKSAEPVARYLRSFLTNFSRKSYSANDQVKLVRDFLEFISTRMLECDIWKNGSSQEFENATEAMEKLVMNRLYDYTFTPQIYNAGRSVTTDDLEKDQILHQRILLFNWVREEHLDIPTTEGSQGFTTFAQTELLKINHYKAPRDKLICVLNCCKVIFGLLRHLNGEESADAFIPVLIFVVLKANPDHLLSNVEYINRFRNPAKLQSEAGYYLSSLMGAVSFVETMDHSSLSNITQEDFERNVEAAIQSLPAPSPNVNPTLANPRSSPYVGEESARPLKFGATGEGSFAEDTRKFLQRTGETISKPMTLIGKIFAEALDGLDESPPASRPASANAYIREPIPTPYKARVRPSSSSPSRMATPDPYAGPSSMGVGATSLLKPGTPTSRAQTPDPGGKAPSMDFTAMQLEIDRAHDAANEAAKETLKRIFPDVEDSVADLILEANNGDVGQAIDQLLEMSG